MTTAETSSAETRTTRQDACRQLFESAYERAPKTLDFNPAWSNGVGLYDHAVYGEHAPALPFGTMARSQTGAGRKLLIISTRLGNVVVFERFLSGSKNAQPVYCLQSTSAMAEGGWFSRMELDDYELELAVGTDVSHHIGGRLDVIHSAMKKTAGQSNG